MCGCFGDWLVSPKLNRAAATNCGFSARQSDKATSNTSAMKITQNNQTFFLLQFFELRSNAPKTFFCRAGDIRPLVPSASKNVVNRCKAI